MAATNKFYKWCFVPSCTNTSVNNPNKHFITVPTDYSRKLKWFKAVRRDIPKSRSSFLCCEDHFNLEEDMENYVRFKLIGGKIKLKEDVVPHISQDQQCGERATSTFEDSTFIKQQSQDIVKDILESTTLLTPMQDDEAQTSTSNVNKQEFVTFQMDLKPVKNTAIRQCDQSTVFKHPEQTMESNLPSTNVRYKSVGVQASPNYCSKHTQYNYKKNIAHAASSPIKITTFRHQTTSPFEKLPSFEKIESTSTTTSSSSSSSEIVSSYIPT